jgi:diguanylate cyclase (GGDEF)-like protein/PAS domain S-box-containing protein
VPLIAHRMIEPVSSVSMESFRLVNRPSCVSDRSLGLRLLLILLLLNGCLMLWAFYWLADSKQAYEEKARVTTQNLARMMDQSLAASVGKIDVTLLSVVDQMEHELRAHGRLDESHGNDLLAAHQQRLTGLSSLLVANAQGRAILGKGVSAGEPANFGDHDVFSVLRDHPDHGLFVTNPISGRVAGMWVISFVRRYNYPDGCFAGVVSASIPVAYFGQLLSAMDVGPSGIALLRDANLGLIVRHPALNAPAGALGSMGFSKEFSDGVASGWREFSYHGTMAADDEERIVSYLRLSGVPFHLVVGLGSKDYLAPWRAGASRGLGFVAIFLLVSSGLGWQLWRSQIKRRQSDAQRDQSLMRLQKIASRVPGVVYQYVLRPDGSSCFPFASDAIQDIYRVSPEDVRDDASKVLAVLHPDDHDGVVASIGQSAKALTPWVHEYRVRFDDGTVRWLLGNALPDRQDDGAVLWHGFITDVTERKQAEAALRQSEERYRALTEWTPQALVVHDGKKILYVNPAAIKMFGASSAQDLVGTLVLRLTHPDRLEASAARLRSDFERGGPSDIHETQCLRLDGAVIDVEMQGAPIVFDGVQARQIAMRDVTERNKAQESQRIAAIAFESQQGMVIANAKQVILQVNKAFTDITGYTPQEAVGQTPRLLSSGRHDTAFYAAMWESVARTGSWQGEIWNRRKSGEVFPEWLSISTVKDDAGWVTHYVAAFKDITTRKTAEHQIQHLAFIDPLTELPNRRLLMDRLHQALAAAAHHQCQGALLLVDLDDFKALNDTLGHDQGDFLLQDVARRLASCIRDGDTVARAGGDEFVVLLEGLSKHPREAATQAEAIGTKIIRMLNQPCQPGTAAHRSTASIGVTLFGDEHEKGVEYLKRAELAMYQAKAAGRNTLRFFDPQMQAVVSARVALESGLREAILNNQFVLHYQAQVTSEHRIVGVEGLVRWLDPRRGMVSPAEFIPLAEETGLILPIGQWVLEAACTQLVLWAGRAETAGLSISVNVSARQFHQGDFVDHVIDVLERTGANAHRLKLELTESVLITNIEGVIAKMSTLKGRGVGFSIDDFGTGYSSLSYLKRLPLDQLKIDQGFVRDILIDANDAAIARMVVALAGSMGLSVMAEGVETEAQRDFLAGLGCRNYQGYLFSRPLPIKELEAFVLRG